MWCDAAVQRSAEAMAAAAAAVGKAVQQHCHTPSTRTAGPCRRPGPVAPKGEWAWDRGLYRAIEAELVV